MASPRRAPKGASGPLPPVPARRDLMTVRGDVRKSLLEQEPGEAASRVMQALLEQTRSPSEGSGGPYLAALQEMPGARRDEIIALARKQWEDSGWDPSLFDQAVGPATKPVELADILDEPSAVTSNMADMDPEQQAALREIVDLASAYDRAKAEALSKFAAIDANQQQTDAMDIEAATQFETSAKARELRDRIGMLAVLNDLDGAVLPDGTSMDGLMQRIAPTLSDLPAGSGTQEVRATRADFPIEDRLSTYMGERAKSYEVKDNPLRGSPAQQFKKLSGADAKKLLAAAGWTDEQLKKMNAEKLYGLATEFSQTADGSTAGTSRVRSPSGQVVEVTLAGVPGLKSKQGTTRSAQAGELESRIRDLEKMPPPSGAEPDVLRAQTDSRMSNIAALKQQLEELRQNPLYASGDSQVRARGLGDKIAALEQLPVDESVEPFSNLLDERGQFVDGGPTAFSSDQQKASSIALLKQRLEEMRGRMMRAKPASTAPQPPLVQMPASTRDATGVRSDRQMKMEQWLQHAGMSGSDQHGLTADPLTGERMVVGGEGYYGEPQPYKEPPKLPGYVYGIPPEVDAEGNITHPNKPMSGDLAARTFAERLLAEDPRFAQAITPTMQDSIDANWWTIPKRGKAGSGMLYQDADNNVVREKMMPNKTGLAYLQQVAAQTGGQAGDLAGGGAGGGRVQIETPASRRMPVIDDSRTPSMEELARMPVEDAPPATPPPASPQSSSFADWLDSLDAEDAPAMPQTPARPASSRADEANRMFDEIPVEPDDTGFLGKTSMINRPRQPLLGALLA